MGFFFKRGPTLFLKFLSTFCCRFDEIEIEKKYLVERIFLAVGFCFFGGGANLFDIFSVFSFFTKLKLKNLGNIPNIPNFNNIPKLSNIPNIPNFPNIYIIYSLYRNTVQHRTDVHSTSNNSTKLKYKRDLFGFKPFAKQGPLAQL